MNPRDLNLSEEARHRRVLIAGFHLDEAQHSSYVIDKVLKVPPQFPFPALQSDTDPGAAGNGLCKSNSGCSSSDFKIERFPGFSGRAQGHLKGA